MFSRDLKPTFGQSNNTSTFGGSGFSGAATSSPFSQSTFGKPATSGFSAPAFGTANTSLFGGGAQPSGGLFGTSAAPPVFGQPQTTQPSAFGFPSSSTSTNLFGTQQTPASGGGLFGSGTTSAFGQPKPGAFGGFGSGMGSGLFGQQQQTQAQPQATTSLFGQNTATAGTSGIFGSSGVFGGSSAGGAASVGTPIKFSPVTGSDTMIKNGVTHNISTRHHCITCMKEYETKSLEELRTEDYTANRKGPQQSGAQVGLFGSSATAQPGMFGVPPTTVAGNIFSDKSLFGTSTNMGFGGGTAGFGTPAQQGSLFSKPNQFGTMTTTAGGSGFIFNTTTTANPFGANTQAAKPFGTAAPQATNLFGTPSSQASTFGITPNQNIGLFNQNKQAFNMPATTTTYTFGGQNTATSSAGGLFGGGAKPAVTNCFGQPSFGTPSTSGFGTSLFSQPFKPATSGFVMNSGTPATGIGTGLNLGGTTSLFSNPPTKPGGLFGTTGSMFNTGGLGTGVNFGNTTGLGTSLGGGNMLGGNTLAAPAFPQSAVSLHQQILSLISTPFGNSPLFKDLLPASGKTEELLKPTNPAAQKALLANIQFKISPGNANKIKMKPLGVSILSKKSLFDGLDEEELMHVSSFQPRNSTKRLILKSKRVPEPGEDSNKENTGASDSLHHESWLMKAATKQPTAGTLYAGSRSPPTSAPSSPAAAEVSTVDNTVAEFQQQKPGRASLNAEDKENMTGPSPNSSLLDVTDSLDEPEVVSSLVETQAPHPAGIVLRRVGYYTTPSLEELAILTTEEGSCVVDNFTVGRDGYGNVYFQDSFDVAGLNLDEIVHFRHKQVMLYPDDSTRPAINCGLNRRAQVTLDRVWPLDKTTHQPIMDPSRLQQLDFEGKLRQVCSKMDTRFLDYRPETGSWVFKVDHFSKYGMTDSDEEDDSTVNNMKKQKTTAAHLDKLRPGQEAVEKQVPRPGLMPARLVDSSGDALPIQDQIDLEDDQMSSSPTSHLAREVGMPTHKLQLMKASFFMDEDDQSEASYMEMTHPHEGVLIVDTTPDMMDRVDSAVQRAGPSLGKSFALFRTQFTQDSSPHRSPVVHGTPEAQPPRRAVTPWLPAPPVRAQIALLRHRDEVIPRDRSTVARCLSDTGLLNGRSFRVGWGPGTSFLALSTQDATSVMPLRAGLESYTTGRSRGDRSRCIVQRLQVQPAPAFFRESVENHLRIQLGDCVRGVEGECPVLAARAGVEAMHNHCSLSQQQQFHKDPLLTQHHQVWDLCVALWGNLPDLEDDLGSHHTVMVRKEAVSEWLQSILEPAVSEETAAILDKEEGEESHVRAMLCMLSGRDLGAAIQEAQAHGDHYTALLLSQLCGSAAVQCLMQKQLNSWHDVLADSYVDTERLRLYSLVAGIPLFNSTAGVINACHNLNWKRAFAMHLWYLTSPICSVTDALILYEKAFEDGEGQYACPPEPWYSHSEPHRDVCYHLLKLHSNRSHSLSELLNPATHTADPLDYRLSWLLMQVLGSIGYHHLSAYQTALIHTSFAAQLESAGLWHWAIFVLLHLKDEASRQAVVLDVLGRHVELSGSESYLGKEEFVRDELLLPPRWIFRAKATLALSLGRHKDAAWFLLKAEHWSHSHDIILDHLAADAIINEDYNYLQQILEPLVEHSSHIHGWGTRGQLLWDYLQVVAEVDSLLAHRDSRASYQLEKLQPQLSSLCSRINMLPCPTAKQRLCQSEIAKRTAHLVRSVLTLQRHEETSHVLAHLVTQLPLPEDYAQQELRQVVSSCIAQFTPHC